MTIASNMHHSDKQMAILVFGIVEICIGLSCAIAADFISVFNLLAFLSGVAGLIALMFCVWQPASIKVYDILGMILMLAYGVGTLNTVVSYTIDNKDILMSSSVSEYWLTRTLGLATAAAGFLHILGRFDTKGYLFVPLVVNDRQVNRALWFVAVIAITSVFFVVTGKIGFAGNVAANEGYVGVSASSAIIYELLTPVGALAIYLGLTDQQRNRKIIFTLCGLILLLVQFGLGRRVFVFALLIFVMSAIFAKRPKKIISIKNIFLIVALVTLSQVATTAYFTLRVATYSLKSKTHSIVEMIPEAISVYKDRDRLYLAEQIHENLSSRTFVMEYLATLDESASEIEPAHGENLLRALIMATPPILYWGKYRNPLFGSEELVLNPHFKLPVWDASNSVLTASVGDFGEIGLFILPAVFCFIFSLIVRLSYVLINPVGSMLVCFLICKGLLSVEEDITSYFSTMRSAFIFMTISWFVFSFKTNILMRLDELLPFQSIKTKTIKQRDEML
jgi:hypothetical protein